MKERPILFSAPMVQALLAGRKTQTRRIVKDTWNPAYLEAHKASPNWGKESPYGDVGDRLWVREGTVIHGGIREQLVGYRADGCRATEHWEKSMPSIHMRRSHCRITLEITGVRVQRLQEISHADCIAEGIPAVSLFDLDCSSIPPREDYRNLWESINGSGSWAANPWVWAISFARAAQ